MTSVRRRKLLLAASLAAALLFAAWCWVDRAVAGLPPASVVRDGLLRRGLPLGWLRASPARLDVRALQAWRPALPTEAVASLPVRDIAGLRQALAAARAGDVIELQSGDYPLESPLETSAAGLPQAPIVVRGLAGARLLVRAPLAMRVTQPWWVLEGLQFESHCPGGCALGIELQGGARQLRMQQLQLRDFATAIQVHGDEGSWPDHGALLDSLIVQQAPVDGEPGATALDLLGASHWRVEGNRVWGSARPEGLSYAIRLRGGGERNRIERNLLICAPGPSVGAQQVGIGVGGQTAARQRRAALEQQRSLLAHNLVLNCNDAAVDVQAASEIELRHNSLLASGGILLRGVGSSAELVANLSSGAWYPRRGTLLGGARNRRWSPQSTELLAALREARDTLPAPPPGEAMVGADTRWLLP